MKKKFTMLSVIIVFIIICSFIIMTIMANTQTKYDYNNYVELVGNENGIAVITGQNKEGKYFEISLFDWDKRDVVLRDAYLLDLTGDNKQELCLTLNVWNSASSDYKTIVVCDMEKETILFPTPDIIPIYDGYIDEIETEYGKQRTIHYSTVTKILDTEGYSYPIIDDESIFVWNGELFYRLEYRYKLLVDTDEYLAFYKKDVNSDVPLFNLLILDPHTLQIYQEIKLNLDETSINKKIDANELAMQTNSETYHLYVEGYGDLYWDNTLKKFN